MKTAPGRLIPDDFSLTDKTIAWCSEKHPTVEVEGTLEKFIDSAKANGRMYADHQAAFRNWIRKSIEHGWDGCVFKQGKAQDPRWQPILALANQYGFRAPTEVETPAGYRTEFERWKGSQARENVLPFAQEFARRFGR